MTVARVNSRREPSRRPCDGQGGAAWRYISRPRAAPIQSCREEAHPAPLTSVIFGGGLFLR